MIIELFIPGEPVGKARAKVFPIKTRTGFVIHRGVTPKKTVNYEALVKQVFATVYPGFVPMEGPLFLEVEAFLLIPKSMSHKKQAAMEAGEIVPVKRPDADNLWKTIADSLQGMAFRNDSQIASAMIRKWYGRVPGIRFRLGQLGADHAQSKDEEVAGEHH